MLCSKKYKTLLKCVMQQASSVPSSIKTHSHVLHIFCPCFVLFTIAVSPGHFGWWFFFFFFFHHCFAANVVHSSYFTIQVELTRALEDFLICFKVQMLKAQYPLLTTAFFKSFLLQENTLRNWTLKPNPKIFSHRRCRSQFMLGLEHFISLGAWFGNIFWNVFGPTIQYNNL